MVAVTFGCSTTHELARASQPSTIAALEAAGRKPGAEVQIEPLPDDRDRRTSWSPHRIRDVGADGVRLDVPGPAAVVVPFERVRSISNYDRAQGAERAAVIGGIAGFVAIGVLAVLIARQNDGGGGPNSAAFVVGSAAVGGLVGSLVGAGLGAIAGYEDRYVVAPR